MTVRELIVELSQLARIDPDVPVTLSVVDGAAEGMSGDCEGATHMGEYIVLTATDQVWGT